MRMQYCLALDVRNARCFFSARKASALALGLRFRVQDLRSKGSSDLSQFGESSKGPVPKPSC